MCELNLVKFLWKKPNTSVCKMQRPNVSNDGIINPVYGLTFSAPVMAAGPAPPANMFNTVPGYEGTLAGGGGYLPPPMPSAPMPAPEQAPRSPDWHIPRISEDSAREAFATYVSSKCCYSSAPVREGVITNMEPFNTYRYRLETFTESRSTEWSQEPFKGQVLDAGAQPAPGPWQIAAQAPAFFQDHKQTVKVPYTSSIKNCHMCQGVGRKPCTTCAGAGTKPCRMCNGSGHRESNDRCMHCNGCGHEKCSSCSGNGTCQCDTCQGKGKLLVFINLNVKWSTEKDEFVAQDTSGLAAKRLGTVTGKELFKDAQFMVYPVKYAQTSRILQQRQTIELIPITKVNYMWKGKPYLYYVYGNEFKVYTADYPATCCCSII
ncbi:hypothetical protein QQF64_032618 [Cirrhinus molitorella]|uniref:Protein SSUH2 homolog n=1 Tax=Cirrhinus molitorella TaxID=172907 RepID=A0ABR3N0C9_9TELE